jgi:hypothetical protein
MAKENPFDEVKQNLTPEDIIDILTITLGAHTYREFDDYITFPTICHNVDSESAKLKLYYYKENKLFHCYTACGKSFDIFGLFRRYYELRKQEYDFYHDILFKITDRNNFIIQNNEYRYKPQRDKYQKKNRNIVLPKYPTNIVNMYPKHYPVEWTYENISDATMERFGIRYSSLDNKIIIPHYDIDGNLVGIRGRALNEFEAENFGKYMPLKIENKWYAHPLSLNLYGINLNQEAIRRSKRVILFEGEKSCLLYNEFVGSENNNSLAVCGSNFNKMQLKLLLRNFSLNEIIICFDKEYKKHPSVESFDYFNKLFGICSKYKEYCSFSFIFDSYNLLREKDSPVDKGRGVFEYLLQNRVRVK